MQKLAIVTSRFWPLIDDRSLHLLRLSEAFAAAGCKVTIVTPRWTRAWPDRLSLGPVELIRVPGSIIGPISTMRWTYSLNRWLREARPPALLVSGMQREAAIALKHQTRQSAPLVLMAVEDDLEDRRTVLHDQNDCALVAPSQPLADILTGSGYPVHAVIPRAASPPSCMSAEAKTAARAALAAVNYDLATTPNSIVALAVGRLDEAHHFGDLVRAWRIVTARRPEAKLWIVGDGPNRQRLYQQISDLDQRFRVMLPGTFERPDELLQACDLLLVPAMHPVPPLVLLDSITAGIPFVAADSVAARQLMQSPETHILYPPGDIKALTESVLSIIERPGNSMKPPANATYRTATDEAAEYLALFEQLQSRI